jgi:TonB family protein
VVVSYIQTLPGVNGSHRYVLPLAADGVMVPEMSIHAMVSGSKGAPVVRTPLYPSAVRAIDDRSEVEFTAQEFTPLADFVLDIASTRGTGADMATFAGKGKERDYFLLSLTPDMTAVKAQYAEGADWVLVVDTSRSRKALDMDVQKRLVGSIIAALSSRDRVKIIAYDLHPRAFGDGWETPSGELVEDAGAFVAGMPPAGATNLGEALEAAAVAAGDGEARIVLIGDGAATLGETRPERLASLAGSLLGDARVTTVGVGSSVDSLLLGQLARQSGGRFHHLSTGDDLWAAAVQVITAMRTPVLEDVQLAFEGIEVEEVFPRDVPNLSPGEDLLVAGRYAGQGDVTVTLRGRVAGTDLEKSHGFHVDEPDETNTFVPLVWASHKIDALTMQGGQEAVKEIEKLSANYSLASRITSFIVLESEKMYKDFAVEQNDDRYAWTGEEPIEYEDAFGALMGSEGPFGGSTGIAIGNFEDMHGAKGKGGVSFAIGMTGRSASLSWVKTAKIEKIEVPADDEKSLARRQELREAVKDDPLSRSAREKLVDFFMKRHRHVEAYEAARAWYEMDGLNADVLRLMGELAWIRGKPVEAQRHMSGILDVSPGDGSVMRRLAGHHEMRGEWEKAHPYRLSLHLLAPKDPNAAANAVFSFVCIGERDAAMEIAKERFVREVNGKLVVRNDVSLPAHKRALLKAIVKGEDPPGLQQTPGSYTVDDARLVATLAWEGDVDLDLWVTGSNDRLLGLGADTGKIQPSSMGGEKEIYYLNAPDEGSYRFRVVCADPGGCPAASGTLEIRALEKEETFPFEMKEGWAVDVARVAILSKGLTSSASSMVKLPAGMVVKGGLDKNVVQKVVRQKKNQLRYCYEVGLQKDPRIKGKVVLTFVISAKGSVMHSKIKSSTLGSNQAESCLEKSVKTWKFPQPKGGGIVVVDLPVVFSPK